MSNILIGEATVKLALEALEGNTTNPVIDPEQAAIEDQAITALREAQQEPVAWGVDWGKAGDIPCVSIIKRLPGGGIEVVAVEYAPYSYTSPPAQRTWVGLNHFDRTLLRTTYAPLKRLHHIKETNTDIIAEIVNDWDAFFTAIEAKLKEKNNG
jgi:hypothetical protein